VALRRGLVRSSVLSVVDSDRDDDGAPHEGGAPDAGAVPDGGDAVDDSVAPPPQRTPWRQRRTLRQFQREAQDRSDDIDESDARANNETRLPENEAVHLGGVTLVEAFTPSTVSNLYDALSKWQRPATRSDHDLVADLERSRSGASGGWTNLGPIRPRGGNLTPGVQAVWIHLSYLLPSVAVVCATFTFENDVADISDLLRDDFETTFDDVRVVVHGRFGGLRARIPWSRPRNHGISARVWDVRSGKRRAVERRVQEREAACARWFFAKFEGRFAAEDPEDRPSIRLLFTEQAIPFEDGQRSWLEPADLAWTPDVYRCTDMPGWSLKASRWPSTSRPYTWTVAARRSDVGEEGREDRQGRSNWSLTQNFSISHGPLVARYALTALLAIYAQRIARLRDAAGRARLIRRPVRDARILDRYLLSDGLDAATVTADIANLTKDLSVFRQDVPSTPRLRADCPLAGSDRASGLNSFPICASPYRRVRPDSLRTRPTLTAIFELQLSCVRRSQTPASSAPCSSSRSQQLSWHLLA
jgi:hypothetical protein